MKKYITKQSSIKGAGKGLFTNASFKKGEVIGLAHVNGQPTKEVGSNHNHNEKNPTANNIKNGNKRYLIASRNLKPGEEITTNYRLQPELEQPEDFKKKKDETMTPQKDGYRTYSPFKNLPYIDVKSDTIDSDDIVYDLKLKANNGLTKFIKKNTGLHTLPGAKVIREIPVKRKGGSVLRLPNKKNSKRYSRSLSATNKLFTQNFLFEKPKSRKNKVFDPNSKYYAEGGESKCQPDEYWDGKKCVKIPKNAFVTSDLNEYEERKELHNDSLKFFKAYQMQDKLMGPASYKTKDKYKWNTAELKEGRKKKMMPGLTHLVSADFQSEADQFKGGYNAWTARPEDQKLIRYYKSLGFTDKDIMYHSSPDVVSDKIKAVGSYFDGNAISPIYKKPVQPVVFQEVDKSVVPTTRTVYIDCPPGSVSNDEKTEVITNDPESPGNYLRTITTGCEPEKIENLPILKPSLIQQKNYELQGNPLNEEELELPNEEVESEYLEEGGPDTENPMEWVNKRKYNIDWNGIHIPYRLPRFRKPGAYGPLTKPGKQRYINLPTIESRNTAYLRKEQDGGEPCPKGYIRYNGQCVEWQEPEVIETDENTGYNAATGEISRDTRPGSIENNDWWKEHEDYHHLQNLAGGMSTAGFLGQRPNNTVASDQAIGNYYDRRDTELEAQTDAMIKADPNLQFIPRNKLQDFTEGFPGANALMYQDPSTVEGEARVREEQFEKDGISMFPKKQGGGNTESNGETYKYLGRPDSLYKKSFNGKWLISNKSTGNEFVPIEDPKGSRTKELDKNAVTVSSLNKKRMDHLIKLHKEINFPKEFIDLKDTRTVRATTGKKINPNVDLKADKYNKVVIDSIIKKAKAVGVDPSTMLAIALQETNFGKKDANLGHALYGDIAYPYGYIDFYKEKLNEAKRAKIDNELLQIQYYNGLGTVYPETEEDYHGFKMQKIYGVPLPASGINMRKNPLYGKQIIDLRDNVILKNPYIQKALKQKQKGGDNTDAMNGMMKARLAYANEFGNPAAKRMINIPDNPYQFDNGDIGTHYMASMDNYAVPQIQDENGVLQLGDYGPESNEAIRFDSDEDANYFAENYKDVSPGFIEADLDEDEIEEYRKGGYIVEEIDTYQNGGTIYTVKGSKGAYKKVNGKWQVDWNRSGKYQPLSKGDVKARTAVLDKMAKPLYDKDYDEMVAYKNLSTKDKINKFEPKKEATKEELKKVSERLGRDYKPEDTKLQAVDMVYPERYLIGPGGGAIGIARNAAGLGIKGLSKVMSYIPAPVSGALNAYFGAEGIKEFADPNSLTRKSMSRAYDNPTWSNIGDASFDVGMNSLNFVGLPFNKAFKGTKNLIKGFKRVPKQLPGSPNAFKSEINWNNWNKEIPKNKPLMQEYTAIEETSKANGTWMKNPDGTPFNGTPEQFVQQQSQNFKNAFGDIPPKISYRGDNTKNIQEFKSQYQQGRDYIKEKYNLRNENESHLVDKIWDKKKDILNTGIYTTDDYNAALKEYAKGDPEKVSFLYTKMNNPKISNTGESFQVLNTEKNKLISDGYDGLITPKSFFYPYGENVLFNSNQLKSATGNNGMFDITNPNIYKSVLPIGLGLGATQYKQGGTTNDYIELDLTPEEIQVYKNGGYIVEEIDNYQKGGPTKLKYKKPQGANVQPPIQKILKNPSAALKWSKEQDAKDLIKKEKIEEQKALEKAKNALIYNEIKKLEDFETLEANELKKPEHLQFTPDKYVIPGSFSNSYNPSNNIPISDNTNIYRQPIITDWSLNPKYKKDINLFLAKKRFENAKATVRKENDSYLKEGLVNHDGTVETVGQFNKRQNDWEHSNILNRLFTDAPESNYIPEAVGRSPFEDSPITGIGGAPKWLKTLWTGTKNVTQPFRQATVSAWKAPIPLGGKITNATAGTVTPRNLLFSYWAGDSAYNQGDSNSDVVKSQSNFINNPSWNTLGDAAFETGVNNLGFFGLRGMPFRGGKLISPENANLATIGLSSLVPKDPDPKIDTKDLLNRYNNASDDLSDLNVTDTEYNWLVKNGYVNDPNSAIVEPEISLTDPNASLVDTTSLLNKINNSSDDFVDLDVTEAELKWLIENGYVIEESN